MSNDTEELDDLDGSVSNDKTNNDSGEDNGTPDRSSHNKSNFKKLSEAKKALEREKADLEEELKAWRSENPDIVKETLSKKWSTSEIDEIRTEIFLTKNPEAEEHMDEIEKFTKKGFSLKEAWKYVKPTVISESKSSNDFSIKNTSKPTKVDLKNMTMADAYADWALTKEQRAEWRKIHE